MHLGEGLAVAAIGLTPAEAAWLEHGRHVLMGPAGHGHGLAAHLDEALAAAAIGLTSAEAAWLEHGRQALTAPWLVISTGLAGAPWRGARRRCDRSYSL